MNWILIAKKGIQAMAIVQKWDEWRRRWVEYTRENKVWNEMVTTAHTVLPKFGMRAVELMLAVLAVATGLWVGWPWGNLYESDYTCYRLLVRYMPSWGWTLAFVIPALPSMIFFKWVKWQVALRLFGMSLLLSAWVLATMLFWIDNSPSLATAWTPVFALYQAWALLYTWLRYDAPKPTNRKSVCPNQSS